MAIYNRLMGEEYIFEIIRIQSPEIIVQRRDYTFIPIWCKNEKRPAVASLLASLKALMTFSVLILVTKKYKMFLEMVHFIKK